MVAAMLGKPLMAWQQHVADVILEIDPATGRLAYDEFLLTVPRQSGKSTFLLAKATHRAMATKFFGPGQQIAYAAQTKIKATEKFEKDYATVLKYARRIDARVRTGNMKVDIRYPNGSTFAVEAGTEKAGHGSTLDEAYVDEAFSQVDNRMEQAFGPAMITRPNKQLGIISTAGWEDASPYLLAKVKQGRALVESGVRLGTAYFEWSAPEKADVTDEQVWLDCMPAVHRPTCPADCALHTVPLEAIRSEFAKAQRSGKLSDFMRAYLNMWLPKPREGEETALGNWLACGRDLPAAEVPAPSAIGVAVERDRKWSSIAFCGSLDDGTPLLAPVADGRRPGTDWLAAEAARISITHRIPVALDVGGTAGEAMAEAIEAEGGTVLRGKLADYVTACADIYDRAQRQQVAHTKATELSDAVAGARWRPVGDGRRVFGRKQSTTDVSMLEAATWALWASGASYDLLDSVC